MLELHLKLAAERAGGDHLGIEIVGLCAEAGGEAFAGLLVEMMLSQWQALGEPHPGHSDLKLRGQQQWLRRSLKAWSEQSPAVRLKLPEGAGQLLEEEKSPALEERVLAEPEDNSAWVRALLEAGEVEAAWEAAQAGGCADELWLRLAARRARQHPEEALSVYQRQIQRAIRRKNHYACGEAVRMLKTVRRLLKRLGRESEFGDYLKSLRQEHRPRRNFIKLLDRHWA